MSDGEVAVQLAEALAGFFQTDVGPLDLRAAAALLPVVREIADQRAAEEAAEAARLRETVEDLIEAGHGLGINPTVIEKGALARALRRARRALAGEP